MMTAFLGQRLRGEHEDEWMIALGPAARSRGGESEETENGNGINLLFVNDVKWTVR